MKTVATGLNRLQAGRTLIELIIAMAIGMVILIGVGALYLSSSGVSRTANQAGSAEDTGRIVMTMLGEGIKAGGYGEIVGSDYSAQGQTLFDGPVVRGCTNSRFGPNAFNPAAPDYTCTGAAPGDQVLFRFQGRYAVAPMDVANQGATGLPDCLGVSNANQDEQFNPATARAGAGTTRRVVQSAFSLNGAGTVLLCEGNGNPGDPSPIVNDMVDFKVFYRFDDGGFALAAGNGTNYAPVGGSIRDSGLDRRGRLSACRPTRGITSSASSSASPSPSRELGTSVQNTNTTARAARARRPRPRPVPRSPKPRSTAASAGRSSRPSPSARVAPARRRSPCDVEIAMTSNPNFRRERASARRMTGVVLPVVLVILTILTGLVVTQVKRGTTDERLAANARETGHARQRGADHAALVRVARDRPAVQHDHDRRHRDDTGLAHRRQLERCELAEFHRQRAGGGPQRRSHLRGRRRDVRAGAADLADRHERRRVQRHRQPLAQVPHHGAGSYRRPRPAERLAGNDGAE